jgi:hypothetical protein
MPPPLVFYVQCCLLVGLRNAATALRNRQGFQRSQLTELANADFESWAKESFEIAAKFAYRNGGRIGIPRGGMDCSMVAAAPAPVGYVVNAMRIADRRMILAGYRLADLLTRVVFGNVETNNYIIRNGSSTLPPRGMPGCFYKDFT